MVWRTCYEWTFFLFTRLTWLAFLSVFNHNQWIKNQASLRKPRDKICMQKEIGITKRWSLDAPTSTAICHATPTLMKSLKLFKKLERAFLKLFCSFNLLINNRLRNYSHNAGQIKPINRLIRWEGRWHFKVECHSSNIIEKLTFIESQQNWFCRPACCPRRSRENRSAKAVHASRLLRQHRISGKRRLGQSKFDFISREMLMESLMGVTQRRMFARKCGKMLALKEMLCKFLSSGQWTCGLMPSRLMGRKLGCKQKLESWISKFRLSSNLGLIECN